MNRLLTGRMSGGMEDLLRTCDMLIRQSFKAYHNQKSNFDQVFGVALVSTSDREIFQFFDSIYFMNSRMVTYLIRNTEGWTPRLAIGEASNVRAAQSSRPRLSQAGVHKNRAYPRFFSLQQRISCCIHVEPLHSVPCTYET